ncbi:FIST N-terminal domain-containing protein [Streptomonospora nanhaiensis]|uniref:Small ligand-binding sensory domain FIST n=1 Tax=Streptomonospora nanhaiensis TaxID=1323731 RepID=A0A853BTA1_9ACTN|nr:FIST N-terminal domain-containing protein [Streptomonospora nanhaiensis]MBV2362879.1 FIST C-terminal domain-containing protein [Streptomonospora nanhaiensis]MBX9389376.1 FIST C-terminal domain-containing protein [Streptomonospora nanhaiensis]NYI97757.1 small ligand-binding sensory domain FIST [Streptomonospora nanhaiensis]
MAGFGDALATGADLVSAAERAALDALRPLDGAADLVCFFVSGADPDEVVLAGERVMALAEGAVTLGCTSTGVVGGGRGVEGQGAVSVWAARLPDVTLTPFRLDAIPEGDHLAVVGMHQPDPEDRAALLLANPYEFPAQSFVERSTDALGGLPIVGGLADGMHGEESVRLFSDGEVAESGAVGLLLGGPGVVGTVVSQGCRPIGPAMAVTKAEGNIVLELAGAPAYERLEALVNALPPEEQELAAMGLHIGIAMDEYADRHEQGDFLVRSVLGADPEAGSLSIGDMVEVGQTVRFQVRDHDSAAADLVERLRAFGEEHAGRTGGALLFSCNGRGSGMFPTADHDVRSVQQNLGIVNVGGFFAAGEIGPVSGRNHVHSFTACLLAFQG